MIENKPALNVIKRYDRFDTLFFVDPPYVMSTRNKGKKMHGYRNEMTDDDHIKLAGVLHELEGMAFICGYDSDLYKDLYSDWRKVTKQAWAQNAQSRT